MSNAQVNYVGQYGGQFNGGTASGVYITEQAALILPGGVSPKILYAKVASNDPAKILAFYAAGMLTQTSYGVPAGKTYTAVGYYCSAGAGGATQQVFGYDTAQFSNKTTPSGTAIFYAPGATNADYPLYFTLSNAQMQWLPFPVTFPQNVFPFVGDSTSNQLSFLMIGYEA